MAKENKVAAVEEVPVQPAETAKPEKKHRAPKARSIEELENIAPNRMTEAEMRNYINYMREQLQLKQNVIEELNVSCKRFAEQYRNCDLAYSKLRSMVSAREAHMKKLVSTCYESFMYMEEIKA